MSAIRFPVSAPNEEIRSHRRRARPRSVASGAASSPSSKINSPSTIRERCDPPIKSLETIDAP
jgi:hypothetical protein